MSDANPGDSGQATVELALILPVICIVLLGLVQVGLVIHGQLIVVHAAREGVRAVAVDPNPGAAQAAVLGGTPLGADRTQVKVTNPGASSVRVEVIYDMPTDVPIVGSFFGSISLRGSATMRVEYDH